jgi:hypothetical protein
MRNICNTCFYKAKRRHPGYRLQIPISSTPRKRLCDKCLNVIGKYAEVWCVPSATHVSCIHRSQNEVLGINESDTYLFLSHWFLGLWCYRNFPRSANINICVCVCVSVHHRNQFTKLFLRQILSSLTFQPLKLRPTHCLSHSVQQGHNPQQWWCRKTSHFQCLQQRSAKNIIQKCKINDYGNNL